MTKASVTIDQAEAAHFGKLADDWWNPRGSSRMLHRLNPVRLRYIRAQIDRHFGCANAARKPLSGKSALDIGCGAGLVAEPLARLGAQITGLDASPKVIAAAKAHAALSGLTIDYRTGEADQLDQTKFDLITALEVIEHTADPAAFVAAIAARLLPGGLAILSTPNRTTKARLLTITLGESFGGIPKGTHDWDKFLTPDELAALLDQAGLVELDRQGLDWRPGRGFYLSDDLSLDYFITARLAA
jgi:2-polyprenyl-6-hydroxyphenyl methylase / 3-demethylubiquinone-9 3-methyltransferase